MESFDFDKLPKAMPYRALPEGYFEQFAERTLRRVESESARSRRRWGLLLTSSIAVAASVAVVLTTLLLESPTQRAIESFDMSLESYVERLSDEELSTSYYDVELAEEFYANL